MQPLNLSQLLLSVREHSVISVHQARNIDFSTHWNSRMNINFTWGFYSRPPLWSDDTWWDHEHAVITRSVLPGRQALFRKGERGWGGLNTFWTLKDKSWRPHTGCHCITYRLCGVCLNGAWKYLRMWRFGHKWSRCSCFRQNKVFLLFIQRDFNETAIKNVWNQD